MKTFLKNLFKEDPEPAPVTPSIRPVVAKVCEMILAGDYKTKEGPVFGHTFAAIESLPVDLDWSLNPGPGLLVGGHDYKVTLAEACAMRDAFNTRFESRRIKGIAAAEPIILAYQPKKEVA